MGFGSFSGLDTFVTEAFQLRRQSSTIFKIGLSHLLSKKFQKLPPSLKLPIIPLEMISVVIKTVRKILISLSILLTLNNVHVTTLVLFTIDHVNDI